MGNWAAKLSAACRIRYLVMLRCCSCVAHAGRVRGFEVVPSFGDPGGRGSVEVAAEQVFAGIFPLLSRGDPHRVAAALHTGADRHKDEFGISPHLPAETVRDTLASWAYCGTFLDMALEAGHIVHRLLHVDHDGVIALILAVGADQRSSWVWGSIQ